MIDQNTPMEDTWAFLLKFFGVALLPFTLMWHFIDKSFKNRREERESMLREVGETAGEAGAKKVLEAFTKEWIMPMNTRMDKQERALNELVKRIDNIADK